MQASSRCAKRRKKSCPSENFSMPSFSLVELAVPGSASYPSPERAAEGLDVLVRQTANRCQPSSVLFPSITPSLSRVWSMLASCCGA